MRKLCAYVPVMILLACAPGCGSSQPLRVIGIQLGRSLNTDGTVASHTTRFAPGDTIYLSVRTAGTGSGTISVRWMYAGRVLDEPKQAVSYREVAATEFELRSPQGFPPGDYTAEVFLDGQQVGSEAFRVETRR